MFKQLIFATTLFTVVCSIKSNAQVIPDSTLGTESSVIQSIDKFKDAIEGGAIRADNLFHSFQEFNIGEGFTTEFVNPEGIVNIFGRVTGSNVSKILGTLSINGDANLFLMNPSGIVFGENAVIDINGSFLATTAEFIEFDSGERFSAVTPDEPLLTINFPIGLGMGSKAGDLKIEGKQNNVQLEIPSFQVVTDNLPESIRVDTGENISLIGGNISFDGGGLQASQGNIDLVSIEGNQAIKLISTDDWFIIDSNSINGFKDVNLDNAAYIDVSGEKAGNINISGRNIIISDGSAILADTSLPTDNEIDINATNLLRISGSSGNNELNVFPIKQPALTNALKTNNNSYSISLISADVLSKFQGKGSGNDINIDTNDLQVLDAGQIRTVSFSNFDINQAGNIIIKSESILVEGTNNIDGFIGSVINSSTGLGTKGNSGNIKIDTFLLEVKNGGRIKADTFSSGNGGRLDISSDKIVLKFEPSNDRVSAVFPTGLSNSPGNKDGNGDAIDIESKTIVIDRAEINNSSFKIGRPGDIVINTEKLKILNGGSIRAETSNGDSASIAVNARDIELNGTKEFGDFVGGISTSTRIRSQGDGGDINITTDSLKILDGSIIRAVSLGRGDAGNINVDAKNINVSGIDRFAKDPVASQKVSKINTGAVTSSGGNLTINSESIEISNLALIQATTRGGSGNGGNIAINTDYLQLFDGANITASAEEASNGGNIALEANNIIGFNNSDITANAVKGNGGNITIDSDFVLGLQKRSLLTPLNDITATSEFGLDGTITINAPDNNLDKQVYAAFKSYTQPRNRELLEKRCLNPRNPQGKILNLGRTGVPANPDNFFDDDEIVAVERVRTDEPKNVESKFTIWQPGDPIVNSNAVKVGTDGEIYLVAETRMKDVEADICSIDAEN